MLNLEKVNYKILNPGGNKTGIVYGLSYTKEERKMINDYILKENKDVEQIGFLDKDKKVLEMAGGEFCVNATRCAIYEILKGNIGKISLSVSGYNGKIIGGIAKNNIVYANMELKRDISEIIELNEKSGIVNLDGITLIVLDIDESIEYIKKLRENEKDTKLELKKLMKELDFKSEAVGVILLEKENKNLKINPIIWVKSVDTLYYETACGSGSLATAIYLYSKKEKKKLDILQPSGYKISVKLDIRDNIIEKGVVSGFVYENNM